MHFQPPISSPSALHHNAPLSLQNRAYKTGLWASVPASRCVYMESWVDSKGSQPARLNNVKPKPWGPRRLVCDWQHNTQTPSPSHEQHCPDRGREYPYDLQYTERRIPSLTQMRDSQTHPGKHTGPKWICRGAYFWMYLHS